MLIIAILSEAILMSTQNIPFSIRNRKHLNYPKSIVMGFLAHLSSQGELIV